MPSEPVDFLEASVSDDRRSLIRAYLAIEEESADAYDHAKKVCVVG